MKTHWHLAFCLITALLSLSDLHAQPPLGWVLDAFTKGDITFLTLKLREKDMQGHVVRIGEKDFAVVGPLSHEEGGLFFYEASAPGQIFPKKGTVITEIPTGVPGETPKTTVYLRTRKIPFAPKRMGKITAVEDKKILFDRGSLHMVHERDIYAVYDSSGRYKGKYEVQGIGDMQAIGKVFTGKGVEEGDRVVFLGQRKLFNLGIVAGYDVTPHREPIHGHFPSNAGFLAGSAAGGQRDTSIIGGGLVWSHTFLNGWGWEMVLGVYNINLADAGIGPPVKGKTDGFGRTFDNSTEDRTTYFILPTWVRKNFFYPRWFSPYVGAGLSIMYAQGTRRHVFNNDSTSSGLEDSFEKSTIILPAPVVGGGIELWPGKFFHPRIEARYFIAPSLLGRPDRPLYIGVGFLTSW